MMQQGLVMHFVFNDALNLPEAVWLHQYEGKSLYKVWKRLLILKQYNLHQNQPLADLKR